MTRHSVDKKEVEREEYLQHQSIKRSYDEELILLRAENEKLKARVKELQNKLSSYKNK
jgi:hypothetical protein